MLQQATLPVVSLFEPWFVDFCDKSSHFVSSRRVLRDGWKKNERGRRWVKEEDGDEMMLSTPACKSESQILILSPPSVLQQAERGPAYMTTGQFAPQALGRRDRPEAVQNARHQAFDMRMQSREQHNKVRLLVGPNGFHTKIINTKH